MDKSRINSEITHGNLGLERVLKDLAGGMGSEFVTGHIYYVIKSSESYYQDFVNQHQERYYDGTYKVYTDDGTGDGIQDALDATQANRDDYVIVLPSNGDYDLTAALTMTKNRVHLLSPAGLGTFGFPTNACRLHQNTVLLDIITVTADCVEIAGFFFKGGTGNIITLSGTRWHSHIHDNFFGMAATDGTENYGIYGEGACSHFSIHDNQFTNYSPGAVTGTDNDLGGFITLSSGSNTRGLIRNNIMQSGVNTEVTSAITAAGVDITIIDNEITETQAHGDSQTGVITAGITASASCSVGRNYFYGVPAANTLVGPTADLMCINNYIGTTNGTGVVDEDS